MPLLTALWWLSLPLSALGQLESFNYVGGIPLSVPDGCLSGLVNGSADYEQMCCPASQVFVQNGNGSFCCGEGEDGEILPANGNIGCGADCPAETDCVDYISMDTKCADPSWQLCVDGSSLGLCCQENWVCYSQAAGPTGGGGLGCSSPGATLATSQVPLSTIYKAFAGPSDTATTSIPVTNSDGILVGTYSVTFATPTPTSTSSMPTYTDVTSEPSTLKWVPPPIVIALAVALPLLFIGSLLIFYYWTRRRRRCAQQKEKWRQSITADHPPTYEEAVAQDRDAEAPAYELTHL